MSLSNKDKLLVTKTKKMKKTLKNIQKKLTLNNKNLKFHKRFLINYLKNKQNLNKILTKIIKMISFKFYVKKDLKGSRNNAKKFNNSEKNSNKQSIGIDHYFKNLSKKQ